MTYKFVGRTKARPLSLRQQKHLNFVIHHYAMHVFDESWAQTYKHIIIEIGLGGGENICDLAKKNPENLYIGAEVFTDGLAKCATNIIEHNIHNIRLFIGDASKLIPSIPLGVVQSIYLLHPDPWPKKKHMKRRFLCASNIQQLGRILAEKGILRVASDHEDYIGWALYMLQHTGIFTWHAHHKYDWITLYPDHILSRYGQKALQQNNAISYLTFHKK